MNTVQLECFMAVAEQLNFARAAEQLHITQPAVTHQINALESELNVKLFKRTTRTVSLTHEGLIFQDYAKTILKTARIAKDRLTEPAENEMLPLSIGFHSPHELTFLPQVLRQLAEKYPSLHPELKMIPFQSLRNLLMEETIDAMLSFKEEEVKKAPGIYMELTKPPCVCVLPPGHELSSRRKLSFEDIKSGPLIVTDPHKTATPIAEMQGRLIRSRSLSEINFTENMECAFALVQAGFGFMLLPYLPLIPKENLIYIPMADMEPLSFGVYYKTLKKNPVLKSFLALMKKQFSTSESNTTQQATEHQICSAAELRGI